jgi:hypothetical protein
MIQIARSRISISTAASCLDDAPTAHRAGQNFPSSLLGFLDKCRFYFA